MHQTQASSDLAPSGIGHPSRSPLPCRLRRLLTGSVVPLLAVGCAYLLIPAFGHAIWYDESYSVALTSHGWSGIWNLGSLDVHPIYYMLLNLVRLVFGEHVVAYRLMSAAASCALVVAGYAMMRRDWGARAAWLFVALACFAPPFMRMAFQIRMYSWAVLAVTMCFLFAMRICIKARGSGPVRVTEWIGFALFSLAGAYRHYYAVLVGTIINAIVLAVVCARAVKRDIWRSSSSRVCRLPHTRRGSRRCCRRCAVCRRGIGFISSSQ